MLADALVKKLNAQVNLEFYSSNLYLQMSAWCEFNGLTGCARFLRQHAQEEMGHMTRLFDYVNETGALAEIGSVDSPQSEFESIVEVFQKTYEHEQHVTKKINELAHAAFTEQDYSTFNFLQWYVSEQHEEEKLFKEILDKIEIIGLDGKGLFYIDRELEKMAGGTPAGAAAG